MEWLSHNAFFCIALGPISHLLLYPQHWISSVLFLTLFFVFIGYCLYRRRVWLVMTAIAYWLFVGLATFTAPV